MKKVLATTALAAFCGSAAVTGLALTAARPAERVAAAQPELPPDHPLAGVAQVDEAEAMQKWMDAATPGAPHAWLGRFIGSWKTTTRLYMGPEAMVSHGTAEFTWLLEGRFLQQRVEGDMMGMPMTGYGITGFDNGKRQFVGTWLDNLGTGISTMRGSMDPSGKVQTMIGEMDEPTTGEHAKAVMYVTTIIDPDHMRFEIKEILYGDPFTVVSIEYERVK